MLGCVFKKGKTSLGNDQGDMGGNWAIKNNFSQQEKY